MHSLTNRPSRVRLAFLAGTLVLHGCTSPLGTGVNAEPGFTVAIGSSTLLLTPSGVATTSLKVARTGGFDAAVSYAAHGVPTALTATIAPTSVADSSTITVVASAGIAAGTYQFDVSATAAGAGEQHLSVSVSVSAGSGTAPPVASIVTGEHTCAITFTGASYCWGYNGNGELGTNDTSVNNPAPRAVVGGVAFTALFVSRVEGVSCGLTALGVAYCWGANDEGQIGDGTTVRRLIPTRVAGAVTFRTLAVGTAQVCGIGLNGTTYCWGTTSNGSFGDGTVGQHLVPTVAAQEMLFQSVVAGNDFTCGLTAAGAAYCWGLGAGGQLGNGNPTSSTTPVAVAGGLVFRSLTAYGEGVCGLTATGTAYCWGNNSFGTIGDGTGSAIDGTGRRLVPTAVIGGLTFQSLSGGYLGVCGVTTAGAGYCWGYNFGAVGDGTEEHRASPTAVAGGLVFKSIAAGTGYACGVTSTNAAYCWGDNSNGALGDGTIAVRLMPVPVRWP